MKFKLGNKSFEAIDSSFCKFRQDIKDQIRKYMDTWSLEWTGAVFFGDLVRVVKPGDDIHQRIVDNYNINNGSVVINKKVYEGTPNDLRGILNSECTTQNVQFSGRVGLGGIYYTSSMKTMYQARYALEKRIFEQIPVGGKWNDKFFQGQKEDVRKELTEYISNLTFTVKGYDICVGKSTLSLSDLGHIHGGDFIKIATRVLVNRAMRYMEDH